MNSHEQTADGLLSLTGIDMTRLTATIPVPANHENAGVEKARFWDLAEPHERKLYNYIRKCLAFSTDSDDVFQETLLRAIKYFQSYRDSQSFSTWLFAIAHNEIRKHIKHASERDPAEAVDRLTAKDETVDQLLLREVYRVAEGLKPKPREVFFLFYDSGFSIAEISRITGLGAGNVKFILNKVRESLRRSLGGSNE